MQLTHIVLFLSITLGPSLSLKLTPNAVTTLLQDILSPQNTEQVMKMLSAAANKKRAVPNVPGKVNRRFIIADNVPRTVVRTESPNRMAQLVQRPQEMCMKRNAVIQNSNNVIVENGNQMILPNNIVVQRRIEAFNPKNVMIQNGVEARLPRNVIVRKNEMPKRVVVQKNEYALRIPQMRTPEVVQQKVFISPQNMRPAEMKQKVLIGQPQETEYVTIHPQKVLIRQPQETEYVTIPPQKVLIRQPEETEYVTIPPQKVLISNDNPFLPVASPISALTVSSSNSLPSAMPKSRGQFLRKIPIPPPTL